MPDRARIISGPRDATWDEFIAGLVRDRGFGAERHYVGVATQERADLIRRKLTTAGKHLGVSVRAYWSECQGCEQGGRDCAYHVRYTAFHRATARAYKARQSRRR